MKKVKVGQTVKINDFGHFYLKEGDEVVVHDLSSNPYEFWIIAHEDRGFWKKGNLICVGLLNVDFDAMKPKPTKKQRIEALEKEVAELKERIEALEQAEKQRYLVGVDVAKEVHKTPNQQRKEIIEKAKECVKEWSTGTHLDAPVIDEKYHMMKIFNVHFGLSDELQFIEDEEKRTVVALIRGMKNRKLYHKGIAKCSPDDVFNVHIGKAIALGRALGKDVSEFENAVQPTEVVVGTIFEREPYTYVKTKGFIRTVEGFTPEGNILTCEVGGYTRPSEVIQIIDDTDAVYEVEK